MRFVSFNINSVRARLHQLQAIVDALQPDFIGLQETKVQDHDFPFEHVQSLGYHAVIRGQKSHHGVALLSKCKPDDTIIGFPDDDYLDTQARLVHAVFVRGDRKLHLLNGYFPQGESAHHPDKFPFKRAFYDALTNRIAALAGDVTNDILVLGDMNIAPTDLDIGIGEHNKKRWLQTGKCSFLPEERVWMGRLLQEGRLIDSFRALRPEATTLSWFDYRSKGFDDNPKRGLRIDLLLASKHLQAQLVDADISYAIRAMQTPSDHAPVWLEMEL